MSRLHPYDSESDPWGLRPIDDESDGGGGVLERRVQSLGGAAAPRNTPYTNRGSCCFPVNQAVD